jgi:hypothetical protein
MDLLAWEWREPSPDLRLATPAMCAHPLVSRLFASGRELTLVSFAASPHQMLLLEASFVFLCVCTQDTSPFLERTGVRHPPTTPEFNAFTRDGRCQLPTAWPAAPCHPSRQFAHLFSTILEPSRFFPRLADRSKAKGQGQKTSRGNQSCGSKVHWAPSPRISIHPHPHQ